MRVILHVDLNNFYASVEMKLDPSLKGKFVGVCGSIENRHGIILAKSENAKKMGVKTGMVIKDALKLCPELVLVEAKHDKYISYSNLVRDIYRKYTDKIEPFGIDECWLDVTNSVKMFGSGEEIAEQIRQTVKNELGLTVSIGVSFNKVFAKLGSDYKKPDAITVISNDNYKNLVWNMGVENLLFVGRSTKQKLEKLNIKTIGNLAITDSDFISKKFGKWGETLQTYAKGEENSEVLLDEEHSEIKSVGNSITSYRDLVTLDDVKIVLTILSESVSARVNDYKIGKPDTLTLFVRDSELVSITRQVKLDYPSCLAEDYEKTAYQLFIKNVKGKFSIRSLGVSVSGFNKGDEQISFDSLNYDKKSKLNDAVSDIKHKYGNESLLKGIVLKDKKFMKEDPKTEHVVHPDGHL
ncbi:MAG: DNA polymerase IV [Clostridia bacterium]|nr:DNA polymerase IV [Clostridia bacterium]